MQAIVAEWRRVLKPNGIRALMLTRKATGVSDALVQSLVEAGFVITWSWPVHTEASGSLQIKDKNATKSAIFLACRPRADEGADVVGIAQEDGPRGVGCNLRPPWNCRK